MNNMTIQEYIKNLLQTSTGKALCDSGDAYGRHWERNQERDFEAEPEVTFDLYYNETDDTTTIDPQLSVYHYLIRNLEVSELDELNYIDEETRLVAIAGLYYIHNSVNTYNGDSVLSQVLQYNMLTPRYDQYTDAQKEKMPRKDIFDINLDVELTDQYDYAILLSIHQGCDVRGGYTSPRIFKCTEEDFGYASVSYTIHGEDYEGWQCLNGKITLDDIKNIQW